MLFRPRSCGKANARNSRYELNYQLLAARQLSTLLAVSKGSTVLREEGARDQSPRPRVEAFPGWIGWPAGLAVELGQGQPEDLSTPNRVPQQIEMIALNFSQYGAPGRTARGPAAGKILSQGHRLEYAESSACLPRRTFVRRLKARSLLWRKLLGALARLKSRHPHRSPAG